MADPRFQQLAKLLVKHSTRLTPGDKVLIEATCIPSAMLTALTEEISLAGALPILNIIDQAVLRKNLLTGTLEELEARLKFTAELELHRMKQMNAYISLRGSENSTELSDVPAERNRLYQSIVMHPVQIDQRVKHTRWVVLRWPTPSMAQLANMSTEAFEDYYFQVCLTDYATMEKAVQPLVKRMREADKVRIVAPGTDLSFSVKGIDANPCYGLRNIPDGECYTAPVKESVNGVIQFNTPTIYNGYPMENIRLEFRDGKACNATSSDSLNLNAILNSDAGARYIGEFALGFNPNVTKPMRDILFDEKIKGSLHLALGNCYDAAFNGNRSCIHWDMVQIQTEEGEIWFDGELIRRNGLFIPEDLQGLNPDHLH